MSIAASRPGWCVAVLCAWAALLPGCPGDSGPTVAPLPPESVARLVSKEGEVTLTREGQKRPAQPGALLEGDMLDTGAGSKALVRIRGGQEIELGENTRGFRISRTLGKLDVTEGTVSFLLNEDADGGVTELTSRFGKTALKAGTAAKLTFSETGLAVDVSVGEVIQVADDGGSASVGAGQKLQLGIGAVEVIDPGTPPPALPLTVSSEARVMVKKKGETKFSPAKKGQLLEEGTTVQASPGAPARLAVPGVTLKLSGTTVVESAVSSPDGNQLGLSSTGPVAVAFEPGAKLALTLAGKPSVKLTPKTEAAVTANKGRIEVWAGEVEVDASGQTQVVKGGEIGSVSAQGVQVAERPRPSLVLPMGKKVKVYARRPLSEVGLELPDTQGRMQVATDAAFNEVLLAGPTQGYVSVQPPASGELHWRTLDEKGEAVATGRVRFAPEPGQKDEASRGDVVAETGKRATIYFQGAVPTLTFTFNEVEGAKAYRLTIARETEKDKAVVDKKVTEAKATVEPGVLSEGAYLWSAVPLDEAGNPKAGARTNKMDIVYDNSLTTLRLNSPKDGDRVGGKATGTAPLGSKLFLNSRPVPLDSNGRFNQPLPASELIVFRLVTDAGEGFWYRRLRR